MKTKLLVTTALALALGATGLNAQTKPADAPPDRAATQPDRAAPARDKDRAEQTKPAQQAPAATAPQKSDAAPAPKADNKAAPANEPKAAQSKDNAQPKAAQSKDGAATPAKQASEPKKDAPATAAQSKDAAPQPSAAQRDSGASQTNQAATPNASQNNAQAQQPALRASASLQAPQKAQLTEAVAKIDVKPVTNVNFSVSVGTAVPSTITLHPVPTTIISIVPQYRGYSFFMVREEIVIVEPRTHKIVDVIERRGPSQARGTATSKTKVSLTPKQRDYIRQHSSPRKTTTTTTGSSPRTLIVGEEAPETVEIEMFPEEVYREVPTVRSYRYIRSGAGVYLVEPDSRRIIDVIE